MGVLGIVAERQLGAQQWQSHPHLRAAFERIENAIHRADPHADEKARVTSLIELCYAYEREADVDEKANILRTLEEISENAPLELPTMTVEGWEKKLSSSDSKFSKGKWKLDRRREAFQKKYFLLRAKTGLQTQESVAKKAGLRRSYVAVIETGEHLPQQKTLQKLAKAFGVEVTDLFA